MLIDSLLQPAPETEEEMMLEIFKYTERVVAMVRPRKLLFMAIGSSSCAAPLGDYVRSKFSAQTVSLLVPR